MTSAGFADKEGRKVMGVSNEQQGKTRLVIEPPNFQTAEVRIRGTNG